jgi:putative membrane protein
MFNSIGQMMWPFMGWSMIFWVLIIGGLAYLFWANMGPRREYSNREDPMELARVRYARGEITEEEYEKIVAKLRETR